MTGKREDIMKRLLYISIVFIFILLLSSFVSDFILGKTKVFSSLQEAVKDLVFSMQKTSILQAPGVSYYIDYNDGNDLNSGISPTSAWKHSPGDSNAMAW